MAYNRGMYTQCPQCRTIFEIDEDALQASLGIVRCGQCSERFDALLTLSDTLPTEPDASLPEHDPDTLAPTLTTAVPPDALQAAAKPRRKHAAATDPSAGTDSTTTQPDDGWFDTLTGDRARALIADAAGIPPEAIQGDPAWQLVDLPVQTRFAELDIIPMAPATPTPEAGETTIEAAESEPFTESWGLDIEAVDIAAPTMLDDHAPHEDGGTAEDPSFALDIPIPGIAVADEEPAMAESGDDVSGEGLESTGIPEPVYVPPRPRLIRRNDWLWATGCAVLALTLATQVAWANRVALVRDPATQASMLRMCMHLDCRLPPIRDTTKLELLSRDIRPDPGATGALAITATFRNNAPYRQPWPIVVVELTDLDNNVVAMRRFRPVEYMPDATRRAAGIAAGTTAAVAFEVADPGKSAVSFHFGFD